MLVCSLCQAGVDCSSLARQHVRLSRRWVAALDSTRLLTRDSIVHFSPPSHLAGSRTDRSHTFTEQQTFLV